MEKNIILIFILNGTLSYRGRTTQQKNKNKTLKKTHTQKNIKKKQSKKRGHKIWLGTEA